MMLCLSEAITNFANFTPSRSSREKADETTALGPCANVRFADLAIQLLEYFEPTTFAHNAQDGDTERQAARGITGITGLFNSAY